MKPECAEYPENLKFLSLVHTPMLIFAKLKLMITRMTLTL